jgi:hypothetical protein
LLSCSCFKSCVVAFCSTETTLSHGDLMDKTLTLVVASSIVPVGGLSFACFVSASSSQE